MNKFAALVLLSQSLYYSSLAYSTALPEPKKKSAESVRALSLADFKGLSKKERHLYAGAIQNILISISAEPKVATNSIAPLLRLFLLGPSAYASELYHCIGAGVPVPSATQKCGVSTYAGFSCPTNQNICNPIIFGVSADGRPVCRERATTQWCFENTQLGVNQFLDPVLEKVSPEEWQSLVNEVQRACNTPSLMRESQSRVATACTYINRQMAYNDQRRRLLKDGYSYQQTAAGPGEALESPVVIQSTPGCYDPTQDASILRIYGADFVQRIQPLLQEAQRQYGIDPRLIYHRMVGEGGGNPEIRNRTSGAYGIFQVLGHFSGQRSHEARIQDLYSQHGASTTGDKRYVQVLYYVRNFLPEGIASLGGWVGCGQGTGQGRFNSMTAMQQVTFLGWGSCGPGSIRAEQNIQSGQVSSYDTSIMRSLTVSNVGLCESFSGSGQTMTPSSEEGTLSAR